MAAKKLVMTHIPVIVLGHLSEIQRRALVLADNQLALNAGWDEAKLRVELAALEAEDIPVDLIGFDDEELERLLSGDLTAGLADEDALPAGARGGGAPARGTGGFGGGAQRGFGGWAPAGGGGLGRLR